MRALRPSSLVGKRPHSTSNLSIRGADHVEAGFGGVLLGPRGAAHIDRDGNPGEHDENHHDQQEFDQVKPCGGWDVLRDMRGSPESRAPCRAAAGQCIRSWILKIGSNIPTTMVPISPAMTKSNAGSRHVVDLVAEGDSVVFRGNMNFTLASGKKVSARVITYYRLANGKIVEDEPISTPPLTELLGGMMPPKSGS